MFTEDQREDINIFTVSELNEGTLFKPQLGLNYYKLYHSMVGCNHL